MPFILCFQAKLKYMRIMRTPLSTHFCTCTLANILSCAGAAPATCRYYLSWRNSCLNGVGLRDAAVAQLPQLHCDITAKLWVPHIHLLHCLNLQVLPELAQLVLEWRGLARRSSGAAATAAM
jgi:hypothetical protein